MRGGWVVFWGGGGEGREGTWPGPSFFPRSVQARQILWQGSSPHLCTIFAHAPLSLYAVMLPPRARLVILTYLFLLLLPLQPQRLAVEAVFSLSSSPPPPQPAYVASAHTRRRIKEKEELSASGPTYVSDGVTPHKATHPHPHPSYKIQPTHTYPHKNPTRGPSVK